MPELMTMPTRPENGISGLYTGRGWTAIVMIVLSACLAAAAGCKTGGIIDDGGDGNGGGNGSGSTIDRLIVTPSSAIIPVGDSALLIATALDADSNQVTGVDVSWSSDDPGVAAVDTSGYVKGVTPESTTVRARVPQHEVAVPIRVAQVSLGAGVADPTLLPIASGQTPNVGAYVGASLSAGQTYTDPTTGVLVLKVTDGNTPFTGNSRGVPDYSAGGPHVSLPWDSAGATFYTLYVMVGSSPGTHYFVDVKYPALTLHNWRQLSTMENRDLMWAWSLNPATPRVGYGLGMPTRSVLRQFDTGAMKELVAGSFPRTLPEQAGWLQVAVNDTWLAMKGAGSSSNVYAFNPSTNVLRTWDIPGLNEPHIDRGGEYVYVVARNPPVGGCSYGTGVNLIYLFRTSDGAEVQPGPNASAWPDGCRDELWNTHPTGLRGRLVSANPNASNGTLGRWFYDYDPTGDILTFHHSETDAFTSSGHRAGQWVFDNAPTDRQWYVTSNWGTGAQSPALYEAIGFVSLDPTQPVRLLAHHHTIASTYFAQAHATVSPDGKLVLWGSNMGNDGGRIDAFLARVPAGE